MISKEHLQDKLYRIVLRFENNEEQISDLRTKIKELENEVKKISDLESKIKELETKLENMFPTIDSDKHDHKKEKIYLL